MPNESIGKFMRAWKNSNAMTEKVERIINLFDLISDGENIEKKILIIDKYLKHIGYENIYKKALELRNYGQKNRYEHDIIGMNSRLDEIQAAFLSVSLKYLDKNNKKRKKIAEMYFSYLKDVKDISFPNQDESY